MEGGSGGVHLCSDELRSASDKSKVIMKSGVIRDPVSAAFFLLLRFFVRSALSFAAFGVILGFVPVCALFCGGEWPVLLEPVD